MYGVGRMENALKVSDRAMLAIKLGESHFREFKSALHGEPGKKELRSIKSIRSDIGEALVAFANADGGELLVGVEDDGIVTGIDGFCDVALEAMMNAPTTNVHEKTPLSSVKHERLEIEHKTVLYFFVPKSLKFVHQTSDGRCMIRQDLSTVPVSADDLIISRKEQSSREYDRQFVDDATVNDIDANIVNLVAEQISPGMTVEKCLQYFGLAEFSPLSMKIRRAALLLFAIDPQRWHPRLQVRVLKVDGSELGAGINYNVASDTTISKNIMQLVDKAWEALRPLLVETRLRRDAKFSATVMYPELACREALINAIAHRDFSAEGRGVEIYVYEDRMDVVNPGGLLSTIQLDELIALKGVHQSRNALVARVLREIGFMQELGEGMRRIFDLMSNSDLKQPVISSVDNTFTISLMHETIYSQKQKIWLQQFEEFELSREQMAVIAMGAEGRLIATQDVIENLGIVDMDHFRSLSESLRVLGIFKKEVPNNEAYIFSKQNNVPRRQIPRYRIVHPKDEGTVDKQLDSDPGEVVSNDAAKLYVGNVDCNLSDEELFRFFSTYGVVESLSMPRRYGLGKGFLFVEYSTEQQAINALFHMNNQKLKGRVLSPKRYKPKLKMTSRRKGRTVGEAPPPGKPGGGASPTVARNLLREDQKKVARDLVKNGQSLSAVARTFNVHPSTIYRCLHEK